MALKRFLAFVSVIGSIMLLAIMFGNLMRVDAGNATYRHRAAIEQKIAPVAVVAAPVVSCTVGALTTDREPSNNQTLDTAAILAPYIGQSLLSASPALTNSVVQARSDFYRLDNASRNYKYTVQARATNTNNYNLGIVVYDRERRPIYTDTELSTNTAIVTFEAFNEGPYFIEVFQASQQCSGGTYELLFSAPVAPTNTPIPTNTSTPNPTVASPTERPPAGFDQYEPNFDFNTSTLIASGVTYSLNFIPWGNWSNDNDFFRVWVKPGLRYTCETSELGPAVDPNVIMYTAPDFNSAVASNDDIELGNFNSRVSYFSTYEGYLYILVGQGNRMKPQDTPNSTYKFRCDMTIPGVDTPAPGYTPAPDKDPYPTARPTSWPTATPRPTDSPIDTPVAPTLTPTPEIINADLVFRLITTPAPVAPTPTATGFRTFRLRVYFDENADNQAGAGEGIPGFFVRALTPESNTELARGYTDDQGQVSFTVPTVGMVRVIVPLLGLDRMIAATQPEVIVRIAPPTLPAEIP
ncbi:MAG TPA: hypothetical protein PKH77_14515 [Anaerolineae bacterium]|nr:hypothetical protein [Anaerolineae bacterium]